MVYCPFDTARSKQWFPSAVVWNQFCWMMHTLLSDTLRMTAMWPHAEPAASKTMISSGAGNIAPPFGNFWSAWAAEVPGPYHQSCALPVPFMLEYWRAPA